MKYFFTKTDSGKYVKVGGDKKNLNDLIKNFEKLILMLDNKNKHIETLSKFDKMTKIFNKERYSII